MSGTKRIARPLSPVHAMMGMLEVQQDAKRLNEIVNHPDVLPWVRGASKGPLDLTPAFERGNIVCLLGKHGGLAFTHLQPGLWEVHSQILAEGRGAWALDCVRACLMWMFTRTDAAEVITRCPKGNVAARAMAKAAGLRLQWTNPRGWNVGDDVVPAGIWSITVLDWMGSAEGLAARGRWFHERLDAEFMRLGHADLAHPDDDAHDVYVGAACEMVLGGQLAKAEGLYNRFAMMGGYMPIQIVSADPVAVNIGNAVLEFRGGEFSVAAVAER